MDPVSILSATPTLNLSSILNEARAEPKCDSFGKPHCSSNRLSAWLFFAIGLLLLFTNIRNAAVLAYILRRHWINTDAICFVISVLNAIYGAAIVLRSLTHTLPDIWPYNQFEVSIQINFTCITHSFIIIQVQLLHFVNWILLLMQYLL